MNASASPDEEAARRSLRLLALALAVLLTGAGVVAVAQHRHHHAGRSSEIAANPAVGTGPTDIGPGVNAEVPAYVAARQPALATATGTRLAVVSLARYATEPEARHAVAPVSVVALIVAAPGGLPSVVRDNAADWARHERDQAKSDFADVHKLVCSNTVDDADFTTFYGTEQQRLLALESADASAPVVFAVVVRAAAGELRVLARAPGIRLVDVGGAGHFDAAAAYRGVRPEEVAVAGQPTTYRPFSGTRAVPPCH